MYYLVLCFAAALLCSGCRSASVNKHLKLLPDLDNSIENGVPGYSTRPPPRRFLALSKRPEASYAHAPGTMLSLTCEALGFPAPSIRWFRNTAPVYEHDSGSTEQIDVTPTSLARISSTLLVTRADQADEYSCLVTSGGRSARASTTVYSTGKNTDITEREKLLPLNPHVLLTYKAYVDVIGTPVVLPCRARGHPRPKIVWRDGAGAIIIGDDRRKVLRSGDLMISSLSWSDMGEFTCQASNLFGSSQASTFVYPARAG